MKIVNFSKLNAKNKARVEKAIKVLENRPKIAHHSVMSTRCTKFVRSWVTIANPSVELNLIVGGKVKTTIIDLNK